MPRTLSTGTGQAPGPINEALKSIQATLCNCILPTGTNPHAGLAIAGTASKVKTSYAVYGLVDGAIFTKAATDNLWTLAGTVVNATFNVFVLTLKVDGTATARMGTAGATLAAVVFPVIPADEIVVGFVVVNPTGTGNFVGGTTALNDATVVPNAAYVNAPVFNPNLLSI